MIIKEQIIFLNFKRGVWTMDIEFKIALIVRIFDLRVAVDRYLGIVFFDKYLVGSIQIIRFVRAHKYASSQS